MEIQKNKIGYPMLRFDDVRITYSSPYIPTAFERILITICGQFSNDTIYREIPIKTVFEDMLGVSNPDFLLQKTVDELTHIDAIKCTDNMDRIDTLPIRALTITERGRNILTQNQLLGISQIRNESFTFDPIYEKIVNENEGYRDYQKPKYAIDANRFFDTFPDTLIQKDITRRQKLGNEPWLTGQTLIEHINRNNEKPQVMWKTINAVFHVNNGQLTVETNDTKLSEYINNLEIQEFSKNFLSEFLSDKEIPTLISYEVFEKIPVNDWKPIRQDRQDQDWSAKTYCRVPIRFNQETIELSIVAKT